MTLDPAAAVALSVAVGAASTALALVPATGIAWVLARRKFRGKTALSALVMAPLVLPPVVTGVLMLKLLGRSSPVGGALASMGLPVTYSTFGAILAAAVVGFPLFVITLRNAFEAVDRRLEEVSLSLGVSPAATFRRITLPLALPGLAAGMVLAFARGLGEFGATTMLAGNIEGETRTIALAVYTVLDAPDGETTAWKLIGASLFLSLGALAAFEVLNRWQRRRLELDDDARP